MAVKPGKAWRDAEEKRALQLLAGTPYGCIEAAMLGTWLHRAPSTGQIGSPLLMTQPTARLVISG
jgi:hypothetical protein